MAFTDYLDLRTAVIEEMGQPGLEDRFDRLTLLAEATLNQKLRTRHQITSTTLTFASGEATLPTDFLEIIGLFDGNTYEFTQQPFRTQPKDDATFYTVDGSKIYGPDSGDFSLIYYAKLPSLTATAGLAGSNWLLQNYPSVYLYAVELEAAKALRDGEQMTGLKQALDMAMADLLGDDTRARLGGARVRFEEWVP